MGMCGTDDLKFDEAVHLWFAQKETQDMPIMGPISCEKHAQLHPLLLEGDSMLLML